MNNWIIEESRRCKEKTEHWPEWRKAMIRQTPEEYKIRSQSCQLKH